MGGLGRATKSTKLHHGLVMPVIKECSGERLLMLMTWPVSSPQLAQRSLQCSKDLLDSQSTAGLGV